MTPSPLRIQPNEVYSPDEAAELLGIPREKVSVLIRDRVLIETTTPRMQTSGRPRGVA